MPIHVIVNIEVVPECVTALDLLCSVVGVCSWRELGSSDVEVSMRRMV